MNAYGDLNAGKGEIVASLLKPTCTEEDYAENIDRVIETDPEAGRIFVTDNLNTHLSVTLVSLVSIWRGLPLTALDRKGKSGILKYMTFYNATARPMDWTYD